MRCARCHSMRQHSKYHDRRQHILLEERMPQRKKLNFEGQCFVGTARGHNKVLRAATFRHAMPRHAMHITLNSALVVLLSQVTHYQISSNFDQVQLETAQFHQHPPSFGNEIKLAGVAVQSRLLPPRITVLRCKGAAMHFVPVNFFWLKYHLENLSLYVIHLVWMLQFESKLL